MATKMANKKSNRFSGGHANGLLDNQQRGSGFG